MRGPWAHPSGAAGNLVTTISLRTSLEETQWAITSRDGGTWIPEARVWNMNEGSYDQREAIFAPAPATLTFRATLPTRARLRVSPALVGACFDRGGRFAITIVDAAGAAHAVSETRLAADDAHLWHDVDVDLSAWEGAVGRPRVAHGRPIRPAPAPGPLALWGDPILSSSDGTDAPALRRALDRGRRPSP